MEAASRGAEQVTLIEKLMLAARILQDNIDRLGAETVQVVATDALQWISECPPQSVDIAFVDPPFGLHLETRALELLRMGNCVRPGGFVYVEIASSATSFDPGPGWEVDNEKQLGEVRMLLLKKT